MMLLDPLLCASSTARIPRLLRSAHKARSGLGPVPPALALPLARAWAAAGRPELGWRELAEACGGARPAATFLTEWAQVLGLEEAELGELVGRLGGDPAGRQTALSEAAAELGRFEIASRLAGLRAASEATVAPAVETGEPALLLDSVDVRELLGWFEGREGVHAVESVDRAGRRSFVPVHRDMAAEDWERHLRGETTLALPLVRAGNLVTLGVLDVDVERRALAEHGGQAGDLLGRALGAALRLRNELERRGCASLFEASGYKGYHLWLRLGEPVPAFRLRRWLLQVVEAAGALPEGVRVEVFPNRDRLREGEVGPVVKLPLGVHSRTGRRCFLLDARGEPVEDPMAALRAVAPVDRAVVWEESREGPTAAEAAGQAPDAAVGPRARQVLDGCKILGYLERKARDTAYLDHTERTTLLCTLGHLGAEGKAALHAVIGHTYNYRPEITERHAARVPEFPMSCPKGPHRNNCQHRGRKAAILARRATEA
jgi:hypothetical protein